MDKEIEIPEGYEARIEGNKVILESKESEDEKIRKTLINIVKRAYCKYGVKCSGDEFVEGKILAYLERQKEQKQNNELIQRSWYREGYHDCKYKREPKWIIKAQEGGPKYVLNPRYGEPLADEQKPTELERLEKLREMTKEIREAYEIGIEVGKRIEQTHVHTAKEMWKEMRLEVYAQASGNRHEPNSSDDSTKMFSLSDIDEIFEKIGDSTVVSQPAEGWREKRENECPFRKALNNNLFGCERPVGAISICNGRCSWVVNHQKLKEIQDRKEQDRLAPSAVTSTDLSVLLNQQNKNKMITEDYVSFETAKLLKEKGFDWECFQYWHEDDKELVHSRSMHPIQNISNPCFFGPAAPTLQTAMKWLRKVHNFHIRIDRASKYWNYTIRKLKPFGTNDLSYHIVDSNTYEEACEDAIKYCLEKLI